MVKKSPALRIRYEDEWVDYKGREWLCVDAVDEFFDLKGFKRIRICVTDVDPKHDDAVLLIPGFSDEGLHRRMHDGSLKAVDIRKVNWGFLPLQEHSIYHQFAKWLAFMNKSHLWAWIEEA